MVINIWDVFIPNLIAKLFPAMIQGWSLPGMDASAPSVSWQCTSIPALLIVMLALAIDAIGRVD